MNYRTARIMLVMLIVFFQKKNYSRIYNLSRIVSKPAFCIYENKDAAQLRGHSGNREADQRLCFRYIDSRPTIPLLSKIRNFKPLAILYGCRAWFEWDLVGNPEDRFSHNESHL